MPWDTRSQLGLCGMCAWSVADVQKSFACTTLKVRRGVPAGNSMTEAANRGLVRPDSEPLSGLKAPIVLASVTVAVAAVAVAWMVWSRSGRV
jgi:hypothetical protein